MFSPVLAVRPGYNLSMIAVASFCRLRWAVALFCVVVCGSVLADPVKAAPSETPRKKTVKDKKAAPSVSKETPAAAKSKSDGAKVEPSVAVPPSPTPQEPQKPAVPFGPPPPPEVWSPDQIRDAAAECSRLFRGLPVTFDALPPIREGACGAPAPVKVEGFPTEPRLEIRPAAIMTCKMTATLNEWIEKVVQPRAKELLHANIIRISNIASYHCRHRYNDPMQRMSNHAYAGALDISEFLTAKGERINVLEHWPLDDERSKFLEDIHKGACEIFGTTLGPGANEAHKNHFHLDAQARRKPLCDDIRNGREKEGAATESQLTAPDVKSAEKSTASKKKSR